MNAWCNGATGIGLARARWTGLGPDIAEDHAAALVAAGQPDDLLDHLCCGGFSRVELLLTSGLLTDDQAMLRAAGHRAAQLHRRAMARGGYGLTLNTATNVQHPSFFRGISGIGYELLRLSSPELLPNVLLLD